MNYFVKLILLCSVLLSMYGCNGCAGAPIPPVPVEPEDTSDCGMACAHLRSLGCEEGQPLADGTTCEVFCQATQEKGHSLSPSCVVTISACYELEEKCSLNRKEQGE